MKKNRTKTKNKGMTTMAQREPNEVNETNEIVVVQTPDPAEQALQQEIAQFVGFPDSDQKKILANLAQLHYSLRGPEYLLDTGNYSRPFPQTGKPTQTTGAASTGVHKR